MALKHLQSLVLRVAAITGERATGLEGKCRVMRRFSAFLSYPRPDSPQYPMAEPDARQSQGSAVDLDRGTAQAVARAGRPGCAANLSRHNLARNPRGTIQSRWSRPLALTATSRLGLAQSRMPSRVFGMAFTRG
jgi:hypothetical protein